MSTDVLLECKNCGANSFCKEDRKPTYLGTFLSCPNCGKSDFKICEQANAILPSALSVGAVTFSPGVKMSTVQAAINRLAAKDAEIVKLREEVKRLTPVEHKGPMVGDICHSCHKVFEGTCSKGGCPMGGDF